MANYFYTAKTLDGQDKTGTLFAKDMQQLALSIKSEGMILIKAISEEDDKRITMLEERFKK